VQLKYNSVRLHARRLASAPPCKRMHAGELSHIGHYNPVSGYKADKGSATITRFYHQIKPTQQTDKTKMDPQALLKSFRNRTLLQSSIFSILFFSICAVLYWTAHDPGQPLDIKTIVSVFAFIYLFGVLQWMFQKNTLFNLLRKGSAEAPPVKKKKAVEKRVSEKELEIQRNREKRLFVHLFSVLQRQGRLMDFFKEDLTLYQDAQIGAAVRNIHENCRKTVNRYLSPVPVMEEPENERVEIPEGFDQNAIKLVGNVVGDPPFTGILRHRGWQVKTIQMPELSDTENPAIIAPAEVEVE
jgi:hypothetical protein